MFFPLTKELVMKNLNSYLRIIFTTMRGTIIGRVIQKNFLENKLTVFIYHDVTNTPSEFSRLFDLYVSPETFQRQIRFIKKNFNIISPKQLLEKKIPARAALITFDDGLKNYFTQAIPFLEQEQVPSVIFLNMAPILRKEIFWPGLVTYLLYNDKVFNEFIRLKIRKISSKVPLFLLCRKEWVDEYLKQIGNNDIQGRVSDFVGDFASNEDLINARSRPYVYFGNHLYNHEVPVLLSDQEFYSSFERNETLLKDYPNYCSLFSMPFGQPATCFNERHINLLSGKTKFIFYSSGGLNSIKPSFLLDRVSLEDFHRFPARIWHQIIRKPHIKT